MVAPEELCPDDCKGSLDPDADLTYEDALLDSEIRHSLSAQYGNLQPPARAFTNLMRAIETHERPPAPVEVAAPKPAFTLDGVIPRLFGGLLRARVLSVLGGNISFLLTGNHESSNQPTQQAAGDASDRSGAIAVPPVRPPYFAPTYDAEALRHNDPVETLAPPRRDALYAPPDTHEITPRRPGPQ
jgi:hypothetical protein